MATYNINGYVRALSTKEGLEGLTVTLVKPGSGTVLGTFITQPSGFFQFIRTQATIDGYFAEEELRRLTFIVTDSEETVLIAESDSVMWTEESEEPVTLYVDTDAAGADMILIEGTVKDINGAVIPDITVNVYESGFREKILLGTVTTDFKGTYQYQLNASLVTNTTVISRRTLRVEAVSDSTLVGVSGNIPLAFVRIVIDIIAGNISDPMPPETLDGILVSKVENLQNAISYIIGETEIGTIGDNDAAENTDEIDYLAKAAGKTVDEIKGVVNAHKFSTAVEDANPGTVTVDKNFMYALTKDSSLSANPVIKLRASEITEKILKAIEDKTIPSYNPATIESQIDDFIGFVKVYQREETKALPVEHEEYTLNDVLTTIFSVGSPVSVQDDIDDFLMAYNTEGFDTVSDFWGDYDGTGLAVKAKMGLRLAAIAGFQNEVIADLLSETFENTDPDYSNDDIRKLATWDEATWITRVTSICTTADRLCVPYGVRGEEADHTSEDGVAAIEAYAKKMKSIVQDLYPLTNIKYKLENTGGDDLIADSGRRNQVIAFLADNPDIDLRETRIHDINGTDHDLTNVTDEDELKADLEPFQRLLQVTGGKPEAVATLIVDGVDSASAISSMSGNAFVSTYSTALGGANAATAVYANAALTAGAVGLIAVGNTATQQTTIPTVFAPWLPAPPPLGADPDLVTLFGNQNYCGCDDCSSMYSPSAYLVDILNFLKLSGSSPSIYNELVRRRSDLIHIDLTCKNTNTAIPYIDIVNELLEKRILEDISGITPPNSFQTNGKAKELAAHPEHIYKNVSLEYEDYRNYRLVYDDDAGLSHQSPLNKAAAVYPQKLPFNLALEESRTYLEHLGVSRLELMKLFKPYGTAPTYGITDFELSGEWFGLTTADSDTAAQIITGSHSNSSSTWLFYGIPGATTGYVFNPAKSGETLPLSGSIPWNTILTSRLDILIQQAKITYKDLLDLLTTDFLNKADGSGNRDIAIVVTDSGTVPEDTCDLSKLMLEFTGTTSSSFLGKLHRFVRLWKNSKMTIFQLDTVFRVLGIETLNDASFVLLGRVLQVASKLKIAPQLLASWWTSIDTHAYNNYSSGSRPERIPSLYEQVFSNRGVLNLPVEEFEDPTDLPSSFTGHTALIAAAARIKEDDVFYILSYLGVDLTDPVTLRVLTAIYAFGQLSHTLKYTVRELISLCKLTLLDTEILTDDNILTTADAALRALEEVLKINDLLKVSGLGLQDALYICEDVDEKDFYNPGNSQIKLFLEGMRSELQKIKSVFNADDDIPSDITNKLKNSVNQSLAKEFETTSEWARAITESLEFSGSEDNVIDWLVSSAFIDSEGELTDDVVIGGNAVGDLYAHYRYVSRVIFLTRKMGLKYKEFVFLSEQHTLIGFDFQTLSEVEGIDIEGASELFYNILRLGNWLEVRRRLLFNEEDFFALLTALDGGTAPDKEIFANLLEKNTRWGSFLIELIGDKTSLVDKGLLIADFAVDYTPSNDGSASLLLKIADIIGWSYRTGLSPQTIYEVLKKDLILADSNKVLLAAKGKQDDTTWLEIAKPLRGELRRKQRDAMVAYLLANPDTGSYEFWRNENELFEHFLIDVEMEPCMLTSRIKQATLSVQLFVDRVMMGFEYQNNLYNDGTKKLSLPKDLPDEWKKWRKWYRVWEANRKVFLYPENWIEPELRDDKSVFFEEFEAEMLKDEVTDQLAEDAFLHYMEKLDEVARLEPVSCCVDEGVTHVFARTYGEPHKYFYRRLIGDVWTPWEVMEIEIKSDHIVPVVWNRRLRIYWTTFQETVEKFYLYHWEMATFEDQANGHWGASPWFHNNDFRPNFPGRISSTVIPNQTVLKATLNWSEYKNGSWLKQTASKESAPIKINPINENFLRAQIYQNQDTGKFYDMLSGKQQISSADLVKSRLYLYPYFTYEKSNLHIWMMYPYNSYHLEDNLIYTTGFRFNDSNLQPEVDRETHWPTTFLGPWRTYIRNMKHVENPLEVAGWSKDKPFHKSDQGHFPMSNYYMYNKGYHVSQDVKGYVTHNHFLGRTINGTFKITSKSHFVFQPTENQFFFEDDVNTYFVRRPKAGLIDQTPADEDNTDGLGGTNATPMFANSNNETIGGAAELSQALYSNAVINTPATQGNNNPINPTTLTAAQEPRGDWYFQTFYHPNVKGFIKALNRDGIDGLLKLELQVQTDSMDFAGNYWPNPYVVMNEGPIYFWPQNKVEFGYSEAYSGYNWELFFHMPLLIAQRLSSNQRFEEAQKWFHYIFNPTSNTDAAGTATTGVHRFWRFRPFYDKSLLPVETLADILTNISTNSYEGILQINTWEDNPFKPHAIARIRILAYMKNVVMKYLDNLIAWADQLFRRDTMESVNEATNLYILASNILGQKPQEIPPRAFSAPKSFDELITGSALDAFSNALVKLESYIDPHSLKGLKANVNGTKVTGAIPKIAYFCLPKNDKLSGYWNTVADRLYKIRNCMNIEGQKRSLPLFEPPIDPAILVKAAAAGVDINSVLNAVNGDAPFYKFSHVVQKANELCSDVKALGGALLSALEKKDAEVLAVLRSGHEISVLERVRAVKETQVAEAEANIQSLVKTKEITQAKYQYYSTRSPMSAKESESMNRLKEAMLLQRSSGMFNTLASTVALVPQFHGQVLNAVGASFGGQQLGDAMRAISSHKATLAGVQSSLGSMAATMAGYERRNEDWKFQADSAQKELLQIDKQIDAANIRKMITEKELENHDKQMENSVAVDEYMRSKYTNQQLYNWMISQISTVYFQAYQLAYDMAKKAERCYEFELPLGKKSSAGYIKFGYWDSLKKGLLSGEKLQLDIRQLEAAYMESNKRELELTKNISLLMNDPQALLRLREEGSCDINLPEELFDLDFPGHYFRRIKSIGLSIPCITGPYTTVNATLSLQKSATRKSADADLVADSITAVPSIATSSAQNDSGMFELNFKDERYLPFEGRGAVCILNITLAAANQIRLFDFETISDVIVHMKYTAREDGVLKGTVIENLNSLLAGGESDHYEGEDEIFTPDPFANLELPRYFSLKHEYANQWFKYSAENELAIAWDHNSFPILAKGKTIDVTALFIKAIVKAGMEDTFRITDQGASGISKTLSPSTFEGLQEDGITISIEPVAPDNIVNLQLKVQKDVSAVWTDIDINEVFDDIFLVAYYTITTPTP